jgi:endonuclease YncB( thermonuclease family)
MLRFLLATLLLTASWAVYADTLTGRVVKVADGDTVTVLDADNTQHRIRLQGIDAPERGQPYGKKSGQYLSEAVAGQHVTVEYSKIDRFERLVGKVLLGGQDMNVRQVQAGLALPEIPAGAECRR